MVDAQTWSQVFGVLAQVYGVLLGLFAIMITFAINLVIKLGKSKNMSQKDSNKVKKDFRLLGWMVVVLGVLLIISIWMLAYGNLVNYPTVLLFWFGILPVCFVVLASALVLRDLAMIMVPKKTT